MIRRPSMQCATPMAAMRCGAKPVISRPAKRNEPEVWAIAPVITRARVVFPAPLAPRNRDRLPFPEGQVNPLQDARLTISRFDAPKFEQRTIGDIRGHSRNQRCEPIAFRGRRTYVDCGIGDRLAVASAPPFACALRAQIDCGHLVIGENLPGRTFNQLLSEVQDDRACAALTNNANDVFDYDDGLARVDDRLDQRDKLSDLAIHEAGPDLVQEDHARLQRQRPRDLEPLTPEERQGAGREASCLYKAGAREQFRSRLPRPCCGNERFDRILSDFEVLFDCHVEERPRDLVGSSNSCTGPLGSGQSGDVAAVERDGSLARGERPADEADQGRLPRAVGPDDASDRARQEREIDMVDCDDPAEAFDNACDFEERRAHARTRLLTA